MSAWLKRFGLHLAAAVGALGVFVGAVAVGAHQQAPPAPAPIVATGTRTPVAPRRTAQPTTAPGQTQNVRPERSLAGTIREVGPDALVVQGVGGRVWRVVPAPGALIRLNGKNSALDGLAAGDNVVILGQAEGAGANLRFLAHAITARRKS